MNIWNALILDPMINILLLIYSILQNFGLSIIIFTILVRLVTYPLTAKQFKSMQAMQDIQKSPEYIKMQKKFKDDKQKLQQEQMKLYQEKGVNPLGSCLPTLIQFPIIIGLYQAIIRALAVTPVQMLGLYNQAYPFVKLNELVMINNKFLWMDLSQPERLAIPGFDFFGLGGIPVLAIFVVITTYLQSKLMNPTGQSGEQGAQMSQMMNLYMPFFMGYLAFSFASGLALYFVTSNLVTIGQYAAMGRMSWKNLLPQKKDKGKNKKGKDNKANKS
jgi:YidC/Oxa1 family membrane protein insertase